MEELKLEIGLKNDDIVCITIGELNENKNHKTILNAIKMLNNDKIHLLICGEGNEKHKLEMMAEEYNIKNQVHFLGFRDDINKLLSLSDIFIQMSYREGLSRSIMEAMSYGLPCIVSKIRGNEDLIEENKGGYLCVPNDESDLAYKLNILINKKDLRKQMKYINKQNVKKYDVNIVEKELRKIYEEFK